jgi:plasmid maintenance system antidote protein VapI
MSKNVSYNSHSFPDTYTPNRLVNTAMEMLGVKTDAALSERLFIGANRISHLRAKKIKITPGIIVRFMDVTGLTLNQVKSLAGIKSADLYNCD